MRDLGRIGKTHDFVSKRPDPNAAQHAAGDTVTTDVLWPDPCSAANGDWQRIVAKGAPSGPRRRR